MATLLFMKFSLFFFLTRKFSIQTKKGVYLEMGSLKRKTSSVLHLAAEKLGGVQTRSKTKTKNESAKNETRSKAKNSKGKK